MSAAQRLPLAAALPPSRRGPSDIPPSASALALAAGHVRPRQDAPAARAMSHGKELPADVDFEAWAEFVRAEAARYLRESFGNSPERVAVAFGVRFRTSSNWLNEDNMMAGDKALLLAAFCPDFAASLRARWQA